jgi:hypothetical protein
MASLKAIEAVSLPHRLFVGDPAEGDKGKVGVRRSHNSRGSTGTFGGSRPLGMGFGRSPSGKQARIPLSLVRLLEVIMWRLPRNRT